MVSGISGSSPASLSALLRQAAVAQSAEGEGGRQISPAEAQKIVGEFEKLGPSDKAEAKGVLTEAFQKDFFQLAPGAAEKFAKAFEVPPQTLIPQAALAEGPKALFQATMDKLAKAKRMTGKEMTQIGAALDANYGGQTVPKDMKQFVLAVVGRMKKDGEIKFDSDANRPFTKAVIKANQDGGVDDYKTVLDSKPPQAGAFARAWSESSSFEQLVAKFMMYIVSDSQQEQTEKMKEMEQQEQARASGANAQPQAQPTGDPDPDTALDNPFGDMPNHPEPAAVDVGVPKPGPGLETGAPAGKPMQEMPAVPGQNLHAPTTPAKVPAGPAAFSQEVMQNKHHLEAAVQSVQASVKNNIGGKGVITEKESSRIASKLERLTSPVKELVASAVYNSIRRSSTIGVDDPSVKPITDWAAKALGGKDNIGALKAGHPIADAGKKLENQVAGFFVDALTASAKTLKLGPHSSDKDLQQGVTSLKSQMAVLNSFKDDLTANPKAKAAFERMMNTSSGQQQTAQTAAAGGGTGGVPPKGPAGVGSGAPSGPGMPGASGAHQAAGAAAKGPAGPHSSGPATTSRALMFEQLKILQQDLMQVMQAMSNILNMMKENAMNAIRSIR